MFNYFCGLSPIIQAFLGGCFTWFITSLGAAIVFFVRNENEKLMKCLSGFAGGIMLSAAFWSLLKPAVEISDDVGLCSWLIISLGFLFGVMLLVVFDLICKRIYSNKKNSYKRSWLVILSITLHNIPEGCSISLPLKRDGYSHKKAFLIGQSSALVEPVSAVLGALLVMKIQLIIPFLLAFAAGAMIFVVISELIPDMHDNGYLTKLIFLVGFVIMMILDIGIK